MNNVREIERINERELNLAVEGGASWHDDYKDSAYIFVGNLDKRLTEGDVIAIFSQYGEILDINLPRVPEGGLRRPAGGIATGERDAPPQQGQHHQQQQHQQQQQGGKPGERRGFGFLLYEDQRSTVLAVDNLNGYSLVGRTLRVDHVRDYKMPGAKQREEAGEDVGPSRNAAPQMIGGDEDEARSNRKADSVARKAEESDHDDDDVDAEDPMAAYFRSKMKERTKDKSGEDDEAERRRRKEERRRIRDERERRRAARDTRRHDEDMDGDRIRRRGDGHSHERDSEHRRSRHRSRSPGSRRPDDERHRRRSPDEARRAPYREESGRGGSSGRRHQEDDDRRSRY